MKVFETSYQKLNFVRSGIGTENGARLAAGVLSLNELKERFFTDCRPERAAAGEFACVELMKLAVDRALAPDSALRPSALTPGFIRYLIRIYRDTATAGIAPEEFSRIGASEIGVILARYSALCGGHEPADLRRAFLDALAGLKPDALADFVRDGLEIQLRNFPERENLIFFKLLEDKGIKLKLRLPFPERDEYGGLCARLEGLDFDFAPAHPLGDIAAICLADPAQGAARKIPGSVELLKASGPYREIEQAMRRVRRLLDEKGADVNPFDIAVAVPDAAAVYQFVEDAARRYDIPVYVRRGMPLSRVPFVQAFLSLLRLVEEKYDSGRLLEVLANPYLQGLWQSEDIDSDLSVLRELIEKENILSGARNWLSSKNQLAVWVVKIGVSLDRDMELRLFCGTLRDFVLKCGWDTEAAADDRGERDCRAREKLIAILDSVTANCAMLPDVDRVCSLSEFRELLERELEGMMMRYYPGELTGVQVIELREMPGCVFDHVFVLNLNDSVVPGRAAVDPVLDGRVRSGLGMEDEQDGRGRDIAAFFGVVYSCRERLYLSYQDSAFDGSERIASYLLEDIRARFDFGSVASYGPESMVHPVSDCLSADELIHCALAADSAPEESLAALAVLESRERITGALEQCRAFENSLSCDGFVILPELGCEISAQVRDGTFTLGATALSDLLVCPFVWYFRRRLGLDGFREVSPVPTPDRLGTGMHACLENIFRMCRRNSDIPEKDLYGFVASELKGAWKKSRVCPAGADGKRFEHDFGKDVKAIVEYIGQERQDLPYEAVGLEKPVELRLDVEGGTVNIRGRIDRLDRRDSGGLRVVDYKRGKLSDRIKKQAIAFQLSVYLLALRDEAGGKHAGLEALGYSFGDGKSYRMDYLLKSCFKSDPDRWLWNGDADFVLRVLAAFGELMEGRLRPGADCKCQNCCFGGVCPVNGAGK